LRILSEFAHETGGRLDKGMPGLIGHRSPLLPPPIDRDRRPDDRSAGLVQWLDQRIAASSFSSLEIPDRATSASSATPDHTPPTP
jgi:hypothetical protein